MINKFSSSALYSRRTGNETNLYDSIFPLVITFARPFPELEVLSFRVGFMLTACNKTPFRSSPAACIFPFKDLNSLPILAIHHDLVPATYQAQFSQINDEIFNMSLEQAFIDKYRALKFSKINESAWEILNLRALRCDQMSRGTQGRRNTCGIRKAYTSARGDEIL